MMLGVISVTLDECPQEGSRVSYISVVASSSGFYVLSKRLNVQGTLLVTFQWTNCDGKKYRFYLLTVLFQDGRTQVSSGMNQTDWAHDKEEAQWKAAQGSTAGPNEV